MASAFALSTRTVFCVMAGVMALAYVVAHLAMPRDRVEAEEVTASAARPRRAPDAVVDY
jgi:hypothetical protein